MTEHALSKLKGSRPASLANAYRATIDALEQDGVSDPEVLQAQVTGPRRVFRIHLSTTERLYSRLPRYIPRSNSFSRSDGVASVSSSTMSLHDLGFSVSSRPLGADIISRLCSSKASLAFSCSCL
jgi:hypothetical protein